MKNYFAIAPSLSLAFFLCNISCNLNPFAMYENIEEKYEARSRFNSNDTLQFPNFRNPEAALLLRSRSKDSILFILPT